MLSDLLDFLLQVSIWGTDNEVFSKRTQRVFLGGRHHAAAIACRLSLRLVLKKLILGGDCDE